MGDISRSEYNSCHARHKANVNSFHRCMADISRSEIQFKLCVAREVNIHGLRPIRGDIFLRLNTTHTTRDA